MITMVWMRPRVQIPIAAPFFMLCFQASGCGVTGGCGGVGVGGVATGCGAAEGCVVVTGVAMGC